MSKSAFLAEYDAWLRAGRPGLAPSPLPYNMLLGDVVTDLCELEAKLRAESGLSSWRFYAPKRSDRTKT